MVHQLSLVSSIPHSNYLQTLATLQALTGLLSPQPISTYTLTTKPNQTFKPKFEPGKVNQIEQYYMKCTTHWRDESLDISEPILLNDDTGNPVWARRLFSDDNPEERVWTLQISDIPIAGKTQGCCQQTIYESTLIHTHTRIDPPPPPPPIKTEDPIPVNDVIPIDIDDDDDDDDDDIPLTELKKEVVVDNKEEIKLDDLDDLIQIDSPEQEEVQEVSIKQEESKPVGDKVDEKVEEANNNNDTTAAEALELEQRRSSFLLFLQDLGYEVINQFWIKGIRFFHGDIIIEIFKVLIRDDAPDAQTDPAKIKLKLLDESNNFQIKVYINIPKSTDVEQINHGIKDLIKLQDFLKNLFVLEIPDRMYMDSRVVLARK
ncbi:SRB5 [[Candida] subhashii]|uniref:Mediator of RNA polymerase II transcription subunit 18 n=1 Tax=[Candida] subhashii TaxID=561895 RepID=A0A8J5QNS0_9ASCO|nr:SRB5 [[Candida] subhashii]KAG7666417.1 SRB5 [[Candida] subhashii]